MYQKYLWNSNFTNLIEAFLNLDGYRAYQITGLCCYKYTILVPSTRGMHYKLQEGTNFVQVFRTVRVLLLDILRTHGKLLYCLPYSKSEFQTGQVFLIQTVYYNRFCECMVDNNNAWEKINYRVCFSKKTSHKVVSWMLTAVSKKTVTKPAWSIFPQVCCTITLRIVENFSSKCS